MPSISKDGVWTSTYTGTPAVQPPTVSETSPGLLAAPPKTALPFNTATMPTQTNQESFTGDNKDGDENDGDFVECYVDFSEYFKAIEIHGEEYVTNSVQL